MDSWLTVGQMLQFAVLQDRRQALQGPAPTAPASPVAATAAARAAAPRENTSSPEWVAAESGAGGATPDSAGGLSWQTTGLLMFGAGALASTVGTFFAVKAQQEQLKAQASSLEYEASMSAMNARAAELDAQTIAQSGQRDIALTTMQAGAQLSAARAQTGGAGVRLNTGSTAEVEASIKYVKEADVMAIGMNTAREAAATRTRAVGARNAATLGRVSAQNMRRSAGSAALPYGAAAGTLLTSASRLGAQWATDRYYRPQ